MKIDHPKTNDIEQLKKLMQYCFLIDEENLDFVNEKSINDKNWLAVYDNEQVAASLLINPFQIFFNDKVVKMGGIGAVSTFPEYRSQKYAGKLLQKALNQMHEKGQIFSMLAPFSYKYYRKYGWELAFNTINYKLNINSFKKFKKDLRMNFRVVEDNNSKDIKKIYESYIKQYNGAIKRSDNDWEIKFKNHRKKNIYRYACQDDNGDTTGYIFFKIKDRIMYIEELAYNSIESKKNIFAFIYSHSSQLDKIRWRVPLDDNTLLMLDEADRSHEIELGMMFRIVDFEKALKTIELKDDISEVSFVIKIDDLYAPWNDNTYNIVIEKGALQVEKVEDKEANIRSSIQAISQLISGYGDLDTLHGMGKIKGNKKDIEKLKFLKSKRITFLNDYF
ncbi:MAG: GNAT family N-acetyltransferase [bacterium]